MSIFSSRKNTAPAAPESSQPAPSRGPAPTRQAPAGPTSTKIAAGSKVKGQITGAAELVIEGEVEGEITLESKLVIRPGGVVRGPIRAMVVEVGGKVFGDVQGQEVVRVLGTGRLEGNVQAPKIPIDEDGFCKGLLDMSKPPAIGGQDKKSSSGSASKKTASKAGGSGGAAKDKPAAGGAQK